jgi:hypothetical protein
MAAWSIVQQPLLSPEVQAQSSNCAIVMSQAGCTRHEWSASDSNCPQAGQAAAARGDVTAQQHAYVATTALLAALLPVENAEGEAMDADERALGESPLP